MDTKQMKIMGIVCLVVCAICLFVAVERYNTNAKKVRAMNSLQQSSPVGNMLGGAKLTPATPAATTLSPLAQALPGRHLESR